MTENVNNNNRTRLEPFTELNRRGSPTRPEMKALPCCCVVLTCGGALGSSDSDSSVRASDACTANGGLRIEPRADAAGSGGGAATLKDRAGDARDVCGREVSQVADRAAEGSEAEARLPHELRGVAEALKVRQRRREVRRVRL